MSFEYLDHTADVQIHGWGASVSDAMGQCVLGMMNYMTDLGTVEAQMTRVIQVTGYDVFSLLYAFMDECLFLFSAEQFVTCRVRITQCEWPSQHVVAHQSTYRPTVSDEVQAQACMLTAELHGELWQRGKHTPGTEIKAITYSNMQIHNVDSRCDIYVIVDI